MSKLIRGAARQRASNWGLGTVFLLSVRLTVIPVQFTLHSLVPLRSLRSLSRMPPQWQRAQMASAPMGKKSCLRQLFNIDLVQRRAAVVQGRATLVH